LQVDLPDDRIGALVTGHCPVARNRGHGRKGETGQPRGIGLDYNKFNKLTWLLTIS